TYLADGPQCKFRKQVCPSERKAMTARMTAAKQVEKGEPPAREHQPSHIAHFAENGILSCRCRDRGGPPAGSLLPRAQFDRDNAGPQPSERKKSIKAAFTSLDRSCWVQCPQPGRMTVSRRFGTNCLRRGMSWSMPRMDSTRSRSPAM